MSGELDLVWVDWAADINFANGDFVPGGGLETALLISLFTHARADAALAPELEPQDLGGWWGEDLGDPFGSLLWLTNRAKRLPETAARAQEWVRNALAWLTREGIVERVDVTTDYVEGILEITITLVRGRARRWSRAWEAALNATYTAGQLKLQLLAA